MMRVAALWRHIVEKASVIKVDSQRRAPKVSTRGLHRGTIEAQFPLFQILQPHRAAGPTGLTRKCPVRAIRVLDRLFKAPDAFEVMQVAHLRANGMRAGIGQGLVSLRGRAYEVDEKNKELAPP